MTLARSRPISATVHAVASRNPSRPHSSSLRKSCMPPHFSGPIPIPATQYAIRHKRPSDLPEPPPHFPERTLLRLASGAFAWWRMYARLWSKATTPSQAFVSVIHCKMLQPTAAEGVSNRNRGYPQGLSTWVCSQVSNQNFRDSGSRHAPLAGRPTRWSHRPRRAPCRALRESPDRRRGGP